MPQQVIDQNRSELSRNPQPFAKKSGGPHDLFLDFKFAVEIIASLQIEFNAQKFPLNSFENGRKRSFFQLLQFFMKDRV
jgi:hypothetical protein